MSFKTICGKRGVQLHFKGGNTIRSILVAPRDKDNIMQKSEVICRYKYDGLKYDEENTGQSARTFRERFIEHLRSPSFITVPTPQIILPGHTTSLLWVESLTISQGPSRRPCISGSMIHPSTGTLESSSCPKYGRRSWSTPLTSNLNRPFHISRCLLCMVHNLSQ